MKVIYKLWLENNGGRAFGEGPYLLLKGVETTGSLRQAAAAMEMAYSEARRLISYCERSLGLALVRRKIGGGSGGGAEVTNDAAKLMRKHEALRMDIEGAIGEAYRKHFGAVRPGSILYGGCTQARRETAKIE